MKKRDFRACQNSPISPASLHGLDGGFIVEDRLKLIA
jgi:hypothetical protein